jgi:broad specificity phosphatase PhoE
MNTLDTAPWAWNARLLLESARRLRDDLPAYLFVRHSHRLDPMTEQDPAITDEGWAVATEFGQQLAGTSDRRYTIVHSPLRRCRETAEALQAGIEVAGGISTVDGPRDELLYLEGEIQEPNREGEGNLDYVNYWAFGLYAPEIVEPATHYGRRVAEMVLSIPIPEGDPATTVILVSHDDRLQAFRAVATGIPVDDRWMPYLGGYILQFPSGRLVVYHRAQHGKSVPYPCWWPSMP